MSSKSNSRVRKSLTVLAQTQQGRKQRSRYFYCLKMLGILPPPPGSGFEKWKFKTQAYDREAPSLYTPKCLHDVLVSSHATTCEHSSLFFGSYHRNHLILFEVFLNFAQQILRQGQTKIKSIYPSPQFDWLYNSGNKAKWEAAINTYKTFGNQPEYIASHYWNHNDYTSEEDLQLPREISRDDDPKDPINALFSEINEGKSLPWNINIRRRWYNDQKEFNSQKILASGYFNRGNVEKDDFYQDFIDGKANPRQNPDAYLESSLAYWDNTNYDTILRRNYDTFKENGQYNYELSSIQDKASRARLGSSKLGTQYISMADINANQKLKDIGLDYNQSLPHYQQAFALFHKKGITTFLAAAEYQYSHNLLHNIQSFIMLDDSYSPTAFIFFPFHTWIDAQYQIYIRQANNSSDLKEPFDQLRTHLYGSIDQGRNRSSKLSNIPTIQNWGISAVQGKELGTSKAGYYAIFQYVSPDRSLVSAAFNARDYMITKEQIRTSYQLNDIYHNYYIADLHKGRFNFLNNVAKFNFDYDYQVRVNHNQAEELLKEDASNIPTYLLSMQPDIEAFIQAKQQVLASMAPSFSLNRKQEIVQQKRVPVSIQRASIPQVVQKIVGAGTKGQKIVEITRQVHLENPVITTGVQPHRNVENYDQAQLKDILNQKKLVLHKLFENGIHIFASYPSDTPNGSNTIAIKPQNILKGINSYAKYHEKQIDELIQLQKLERILRDGLAVGNILIFGKGEAAKDCINCKAYKVRYQDVDDALRQRVPELWKQIHLQSLNKVFYDSRDITLKPKCIYQKLSLLPNPKFTNYKFVRGAEEIEVEVVDKTHTQGSKFIRIEAESYSVEHDKISIIPTKKFYSFNAKLDFYKMFDVQDDEKKDHFDHYVYKVLKGWVTLATKESTKRTDFSVSIPCFQRLLRVTIEVRHKDDKLELLILDEDYDLKVEYYERASKA